MDTNVIIALAGALAGAAIAGIFSILVGALQAGRDHDRWVRESRYRAYSDFLVAIDAWHEASTTDWLEAAFSGEQRLEIHRKETLLLSQNLNRAASLVSLIGPDAVRFAGERYHAEVMARSELAQSVHTVDEIDLLKPLADISRIQEHRSMLLGLMNYAIGIGPRRPLERRFRRVE